jgi:SWI/SNF-related matrix-associated actin-dependent regulator of chromatin subfamily A3
VDGPSIATVDLHGDVAGSGYHQLRIALNRIHTLQTNDGKDIAVLNTQASRALSELDRQSLVSYNVYVAAAEWTAKVRSFRHTRKSICLDIEIHFYGSSSNSASVGKILSDNRLFLQQPDFLDSPVPYKNPHEIIFPSISGSLLPMRGPRPSSTSANESPLDFVTTVLSDLSHAGSLVGRNVDMSLVSSELKP